MVPAQVKQEPQLLHIHLLYNQKTRTLNIAENTASRTMNNTNQHIQSDRSEITEEHTSLETRLQTYQSQGVGQYGQRLFLLRSTQRVSAIGCPFE